MWAAFLTLASVVAASGSSVHSSTKLLHDIDIKVSRRLESSSPSTVTISSSAPSTSPSSEVTLSNEPSVSPSSAPSVAVTQRDALLTFAAAVGAETSVALEDWFDNETSYCNFTGVECDDEDYVIKLDLQGKNLTGTLPESIGQLERLHRLVAKNNSLEGTLPPSLMSLTELRQLNLGRNNFNGTIPEVPDMLPRLKRLHLHMNNLSGSIPSLFCNLTNLEALDISDNTQMIGEIPSCLGDLKNLTNLEVRDIGLVGQVPSSLCGDRVFNDLVNNTFGCDAIACAAGSYEPKEGRKVSANASCLPCDVPSNVIGSTICVELDGNEIITREPTMSPAPSDSPSVLPTGYPTITPVPTLSPSAHPSLLPSISSVPSTSPSLPPSALDSEGPSHQPSSSSSPSELTTAEPSASPFQPSNGLTLSPSASPSAGPEPQVTGSAPTATPSASTVIGGINNGDDSNKSSSSINKPLVGCLFGLAGVVCIIAIFAIRRYSRSRQVGNEAEDMEYINEPEPEDRQDTHFSTVDSVSYLYDMEDGSTIDGASRMPGGLDDVSEANGGYEVDDPNGGETFDTVNFANTFNDQVVSDSSRLPSSSEQGSSRQIKTPCLLNPCQVVPRTLKHSVSDPQPKMMDENTHQEDEQEPNPALDDGKELAKVKMGVFGSLFRSSLSADDASMKSFASRSSVNTTTPILIDGSKLRCLPKSDEYLSDTDSDTVSLPENGMSCQAWGPDDIFTRLGLRRNESM